MRMDQDLTELPAEVERYPAPAAYCSTGCNLTVRLAAGAPPKVSATSTYPVNQGKACPKGFQFLGHLSAPTRAQTPIFVTTTAPWGPSPGTKPSRCSSIACGTCSGATTGVHRRPRHRPDDLRGTGLPRSPRPLRHGHSPLRQQHPPMHGHRCRGLQTIVRLRRASLQLSRLRGVRPARLRGANPVVAHPIMWQRVKKNLRNPRIIVIDPRATETATAAGVEHYPILPKSDLQLFYGLGRLFLARDWVNHEFVERHTRLRKPIANTWPPTGLGAWPWPPVCLPAGSTNSPKAIHAAERVSFWWTMGVNQGHQAVRTTPRPSSTWPSSRATSADPAPAPTPSPVNATPWARGCSATPPACSAGATSPTRRTAPKWPLCWAWMSHSFLTKPEWPTIRFWTRWKKAGSKACGSSAPTRCHSWPHRDRLERVLRKAEFVVVQDMFHDTATAHFAHLILPAAGCGEKRVRSSTRAPPGSAKESVGPPR